MGIRMEKEPVDDWQAPKPSGRKNHGSQFLSLWLELGSGTQPAAIIQVGGHRVTASAMQPLLAACVVISWKPSCLTVD